MLLRGDKRWKARLWACVLGAAVSCVLLPGAASAARHYEKVSPADKGQGDIVGDGFTTVASREGDAVAFNSRTPFGDTVGSGIVGQSQFVARRSDTAWMTHAITPTPRPDAYQTFFAPTRLQNYSEDLRRALVWGYDLPGGGGTPLRNNIYVEDTATLGLRPVTLSQVDQPTIFDFLDQHAWGYSADLRHVSFVSATQFLPGAALNAPNVYQWDDGVLSLAGILPDGTVDQSGSDLVPADYPGAMSADGSRLVFTVPSSRYGPSQLFMRIDEARTVWISQPELPDDPQDPSDDQQNDSNPSPAALEGVTPDGHTVFFTTDARLVADDNNGAPDLYRYVDSADPSRPGNLTRITQDSGGELIGMSDDGERVYYRTTGATMWVWDHGTSRVVADGVTKSGLGIEWPTLTASDPGLGRVTPDGRFVAFFTRGDVLGRGTNGFFEVYLYDLADGSVTCVSCPSGPARADATVQAAVTTGRPSQENIGFRPHFLSDNGHVFFSTAEELVPQDRNGVVDAYEFDPATGTVSLLSTGTGRDPTTFADASASGNDVFLVTRQRLVSSDHDDLVDLYDARDGSSLPVASEDTTPPCDGDACQPPPSASPPDDALGSLLFNESSAGGKGKAGLAVRHRVTVHGAVGSLRVRLSSAGKLTWSGKGLRRGSVRRARSGTYVLRLRLGRHARARFDASGTYKTSLHLRFVSASGGEVQRTTRVTFRAAAKKGR